MTSDQSVTSSSSQARHFGLYRTIDARTEEFLRLSRKRQIRQGCACAAVSTAITVTIIVSILLVFELNFNQHDEHKRIHNWRGMMNNNTADENLYNNVNYNIDKITLKMLPILIKAINKNKLIDKFLDVYTTPRSVYERRYTTEFTYKKNVFSDRNNWIRFPTSRLLAIEYKTSPIVYFKTPKNDYFTKIRKIRDYQRIMNYVDKMISDRVTFGSTQAMTRNDDYASDDTQTQKTVTFPLTKNNNKKAESQTYNNLKKEKSKDEKFINCKCPKKIGQILSNLISNIKLLMPSYESTESTNLIKELEKSPCKKDVTKAPSSRHPISNLNNEDTEQSINQNVTPSTTSVYDVKVDVTEQNAPTNLNDLKRDQTLKTIVNLLQPKYIGQKTYIFHTKHSTSPPMFIETTEAMEEKTTSPILKQSSTKRDPSHIITTSPDYNFLNKEYYNKRIPPEPVYNEDTDDNEILTTNSVDSFLNLDVHSLELVKRKLISTCKKTKEIVIKQPYRSIKNKPLKNRHDRKWYNFHNNTSVDITKIVYPISTVQYLYQSQNKTFEISTAKTVMTAEATTTTTEKRHASSYIKMSTPISSTTDTTTTTAIINSSKTTVVDNKLSSSKSKLEPKHEKKVLDQKFKDEGFRSEEINLDDDFEKIMIEDNYQENDYKDRHNMEDILGNKENNIPEISDHKSAVVPKSVDTKDKDDFFFTSMALYNKPRSYLDIQKSNLKDDNYNFDLNNFFV